ncbi:MAG: class I SAM-dependent methyltransferase [Burkholderiales bacterium]|nr:class I SAM-dependent methyltransferase [Burkholderiales bacterium]
MVYDSNPGATPSGDAAWRALHAAACAPYRRVPHFWRRVNAHWAWFWARGKLQRDPVFRGLIERGDLPPRARVVDIGCGQGLMAALLQACAELAAAGRWPAGWPAAPSASAYTGIELMQRDVDRADAALRTLPSAPRLVCADMRNAPLPPCDLVVILDVLHYVDHAAQLEVLQRVRVALAAGQARRSGPGRLVLRVGDAAQSQGYAASQWVDRLVTGVRGHRAAPTWGRTLSEWRELLRQQGYTVRSVPMSRGTPFANVLLVADLEGIRESTGAHR